MTFFVSGPALAQWVDAHVPTGGNVTALALDGSDLLAGTQRGVYRTTDDGAWWTTAVNALSSSTVKALLVWGNKMFAGTYWGLYVSTDRGVSWSLIDLNTYPYVPNVVSLAGSGTTILAGVSGVGIFRSTDGGTIWAAADSGVTNSLLTALTSQGSVFYAGTWGDGVFRSEDNGETWAATNAGLSSRMVSSLAATDTLLYAGTLSDGVWRQSRPDTLWIRTSDGLGPGRVTTLYAAADYVLAGISGGGVFRSLSKGNTWSAMNSGLDDLEITAFLSKDTTIFVGTAQSGVFLSTVHGDGWSSASNGLLNRFVYAVAATGEEVLAGTDDGVFYLKKKGLTWFPRDYGLTTKRVRALKKGNLAEVWAGTVGGGAFYSTDNGGSWTANNQDLPNSYANAFAQGTSSVYLGTDQGVFTGSYSLPWTQVGTGLENTRVLSLVQSGATLYAGTEGSGVYRKDYLVSRWVPLISGLGNDTVAAITTNGSYLFAGTLGGGLFRSPVSDTVWTSVNAGLGDLHVDALFTLGSLLLAGTRTGVYLSNDNGAHWLNMSEGLPEVEVLSLAATTTDVYAGTVALGLWSRPISEFPLTGVATTPVVPLAMALEQNFPNPFNPSTVIRYQVSAAGNVRLAVYDLLGHEVTVLVNEKKSPGTYQVRFDASGLSSGLYFYRLTAGDFAQTRKLVYLQ